MHYGTYMSRELWVEVSTYLPARDALMLYSACRDLAQAMPWVRAQFDTYPYNKLRAFKRAMGLGATMWIMHFGMYIPYKYKLYYSLRFANIPMINKYTAEKYTRMIIRECRDINVNMYRVFVEAGRSGCEEIVDHVIAWIKKITQSVDDRDLKWVLYGALSSNNIALVNKYIQYVDEISTRVSVKTVNIEILTQICNNKRMIIAKTLARHNRLDIIRRLGNCAAINADEGALGACKGDHLDLVKYFVSMGIKYPRAIMCAAVKYGHRDCAMYMASIIEQRILIPVVNWAATMFDEPCSTNDQLASSLAHFLGDENRQEKFLGYKVPVSKLSIKLHSHHSVLRACRSVYGDTIDGIKYDLDRLLVAHSVEHVIIEACKYAHTVLLIIMGKSGRTTWEKITECIIQAQYYYYMGEWIVEYLKFIKDATADYIAVRWSDYINIILNGASAQS